jgi:phenylalanyl-tRNA synthetase beta chain
MDIKITHSLLTQFLKTEATPEQIAEKLSLCGPTVDKLEKIDNDYIYHIEIITNRVDAASAFGVAREAYAILNQHGIKASLVHNPYNLSLQNTGNLPKNDPVNVKFQNEQLVPHFACIALNNVSIKPSPKPVVAMLEACGERSLNNIIDISNELTLKYGQPVHIFDLNRIKKQRLFFRESTKGEKITTLDKKTHVLPGGDIVIEDGEGRLIDLCGIMGGDLSSVTDQTKNVLLFVQTYDAKHIRKTSLVVQNRSLAAQLFEKQPDSEIVLPVLIEGIRLIQERAGGIINSSLMDIYKKQTESLAVDINLRWLESIAGIAIPKNQVVSILQSVGFKVRDQGNRLSCTVPSWRANDIHIKEDLVEEVTRIYGYFKLPSTLPITDIPKSGTEPALTLEHDARSYISTLGFTEIYNYALVSKTLLNQTGMSYKNLFKLQNPLSEEYEYMRPSLIPSLLQNLDYNRGLVASPIKIFELANIYKKKSNTPLAEEIPTLTLASVGTDYRTFKGQVGAVLKQFHIAWKQDSDVSKTTPFDPKKSGMIKTKDNKVIGIIGYIDEEIAMAFHLSNVLMCELDFSRISESATLVHHFFPIPTNPPVIEDLTFTIPKKMPIHTVVKTIVSINSMIENVSLKEIYNQNFTFTITYRSPDKNLTTDEVAPVRKQIVDSLTAQSIVLVGKI